MHKLQFIFTAYLNFSVLLLELNTWSSCSEKKIETVVTWQHFERFLAIFSLSVHRNGYMRASIQTSVRRFVRSFVRTNLVTIMSHERSEQSQRNLQGIIVNPQ